MKFSIIVPHYDHSISDEIFIRGMESLQNQTFKDFEVLVYHDGPASRDVPMPSDDRFKLTITKERENNWGHGNRDRGIREANGEYIIHFNPDNYLFSGSLDKIAEQSNRYYPPHILSNNEIIIFPIFMMGMQCNGKGFWRDKFNAHENYFIMTGYPTLKYNVDAMQLVMKRKTWLSYGGWYDKSEESDGNMYPRFVSELGARYCGDILGEHW